MNEFFISLRMAQADHTKRRPLTLRFFRLINVMVLIAFVVFASLSVVMAAETASPLEERNRVEFEAWRAAIPDYDRRVYDRLKTLNKRTVRIQTLSVIAAVFSLLSFFISIFIVTRISKNDHTSASGKRPVARKGPTLSQHARKLWKRAANVWAMGVTSLTTSIKDIRSRVKIASPAIDKAPPPPPRKPSKLIDGLSVATALFFPFALLFIVYPLEIFSNNLDELHGNFLTISPLLSIAAVIGAGCLILGMVLSFLRFSGLWGVAALGLYLGFYIIVSDMVAPLALDKHIGFDGSENILQPPSIQIIFDVMVFLVLAVLFSMFRKPGVVKVGATMAFVFMAMTIGGSVQRLSAAESKAEPVEQGLSDAKWQVKEQPPGTPADFPNVYHIILDGFQGVLLPRAMELADLTAKDFDGFSYFPKNRSNYDGTQMSFPSFMSGTIYRTGSMKKWYRAWNTDGMWSNIKKAYPANLQIYSAHGGNSPAPYNALRKMSTATAGTRRAEDFTDIIFHLSLAKVAPSYLHQDIFFDGKGVFSPKERVFLNDDDPRLQPLRLYIEDEPLRPSRGQYAYVHVFVPHGPYLLDEKCKLYAHNTLPKHFDKQSACALRYVQEFILELKRLGRYRDSVIVVHSDHGFANEGGPIEPLTGSPDEARITELDVTAGPRRTARHLDTMTAALLMVKPAGSSGAPMVTSKRSTQLLDLPNTMYDLLSLDIKAPEGMSVLSEDYPESAERHVYPGFRRWDHEANKQIWIGKEVLEGEINHFSWTSGKGWKVYPNMPFSWE